MMLPMTSRWKSLAAAVVAGGFGLTPRHAAAHGADLAQEILLALIVAGLAALAVVAVFVGGIVGFVLLRRDSLCPRRRRWARRLGWTNTGLGLVALTGAIIAVPRSADGWKMIPVSLGLVGLGVVLLLAERKARRFGSPHDQHPPSPAS